MPIYHFDIEQHSPEWYAIKAGKWSASNAATIMGGLETKGLDDLVRTIAWERVFGPANEPRYQSAAMQRGNEVEEEAREWVAFQIDDVIEQCGFVEHATIANAGWSPDGLRANRKIAQEIKCPLHKAYMEVVRKREVPSEYRWQVRWGMWVGELDGLDFTVYHPQAGGIIVPVEPDRSTHEQMVERVDILEKRVKVWTELLAERRAS